MSVSKIALLAVVIGCSKPTKKSAYEHVARQLNPLVLLLQPSTAKLRLTDGDDARMRTCAEASDVFQRLYETTNFELSDESAALAELSMASDAYGIGAHWLQNCVTGEKTFTRSSCVEVCTVSWSQFINGLERLRECARQEGVEIVSLGGVADPEKKCP